MRTGVVGVINGGYGDINGGEMAASLAARLLFPRCRHRRDRPPTVAVSTGTTTRMATASFWGGGAVARLRPRGMLSAVASPRMRVATDKGGARWRPGARKCRRGRERCGQQRSTRGGAERAARATAFVPTTVSCKLHRGRQQVHSGARNIGDDFVK